MIALTVRSLGFIYLYECASQAGALTRRSLIPAESLSRWPAGPCSRAGVSAECWGRS